MAQANRLIGQTHDQVVQQQDAWRQAAQRVSLTWSEWSAADSPRKAELYRRYASALDAEELAAATLERLVGNCT